MKRRSFLQSISAVFAAPIAPNVSLAASTGVGFSAPSEFLSSARLIARAHNKCSRSMLMRHLKVDASMAARVEGMLLEKGIITLPDAAGFSRAINPIIANPMPQAVKVVRQPVDDFPKLKDRFSNFGQSDCEEEDQLISENEIESTTETDPAIH